MFLEPTPPAGSAARSHYIPPAAERVALRVATISMELDGAVQALVEIDLCVALLKGPCGTI
jgi:hypothetical protein